MTGELPHGIRVDGDLVPLEESRGRVRTHIDFRRQRGQEQVGEEDQKAYAHVAEVSLMLRHGATFCPPRGMGG